jgi:hypothetical protein
MSLNTLPCLDILHGSVFHRIQVEADIRLVSKTEGLYLVYHSPKDIVASQIPILLLQTIRIKVEYQQYCRRK